jgi:hypothetical protein
MDLREGQALADCKDPGLSQRRENAEIRLFYGLSPRSLRLCENQDSNKHSQQMNK